MVKSRAEIQREYRQRLKQDPLKYELYLSKARKRKQNNYVPSGRLSRADKSKRNQKNLEYLHRHRQKKVRERNVANLQQEQEVMDTSGYETASTSTSEQPAPLIVNLPFPNRKAGARKRISRALAKKSKEYKQLKDNYEELRMKYKRNLRSVQRLKKKQRDENTSSTEKKTTDKDAPTQEPSDTELAGKEVQQIDDVNNDIHSQNTSECSSPAATIEVNEATCVDVLTPNSKTKKLIDDAGLTKKQSSKVKKQLLLGFVVQSNIQKQRRGVKPTQLGALRGLIGGKILSKYRLGRSVNKSTGLGRNRLSTSRGSFNPAKQTRAREIQRYRHQVIDFLQRDDNSRANPGKADKIKADGTTHQTRTLTDYLKNLHQKFLSENPAIKLSLASFCRIRPAYIKATAFISRSCCLCTKHQNMALCVQAMKNAGLPVPLNPEHFADDDKHIELMKNELPEKIKFGQWKRVPIEDKGQKKMIMKIVDNELDKTQFIEFMIKQTEEFRLHVGRVKRQYSEIHSLKQNLEVDEVIIHMDFAENYSCKTVEEIQSAYWTQTGVTLHPAVVYFKDNDGNLQHQSFVVVSDEMGHNSSTVLSFIDSLVPEVKNIVPNVRIIHYWTDSPTSQYRNKAIFHTVANHESIYGVKAVWNFFESGHGKGPCDGLGGTTKRMADEAVKSGKIVIQDAADFFAWSQSNKCSMKNVKFMFVSSEVCKQKADLLSQTTLKPVKGTMKVHSVVGKGNNTIMVADVSCYCPICTAGNYSNCTNKWTVETLNKNVITPPKNDATQSQEKCSIAHTETCDASKTDLEVGDFVAAMYKKEWFVGKILQLDDENEVEITFMKHSRQFFQWPRDEDVIWVKVSDVLLKINDPSPTGKSKRMFKISDNDFESIEALYGMKMQ